MNILALFKIEIIEIYSVFKKLFYSKLSTFKVYKIRNVNKIRKNLILQLINNFIFYKFYIPYTRTVH